MFHIGTKVVLFNDATGVVVGYGTVDRDADPRNTGEDVVPVYLVSLDHGIWSADQSCFVSVLAVHADSLRRADVVPA